MKQRRLSDDRVTDSIRGIQNACDRGWADSLTSITWSDLMDVFSDLQDARKENKMGKKYDSTFQLWVVAALIFLALTSFQHSFWAQVHMYNSHGAPWPVIISEVGIAPTEGVAMELDGDVNEVRYWYSTTEARDADLAEIARRMDLMEDHNEQ